MRSLRIICPNGHLGFAPLRVESFQIGVAAQPDYVAADSGSDDVGPVPLGTDTSTSPLAWQTQDLEHMLLASRRLGVPMIIGSSGDTGANSRVDLYVQAPKQASYFGKNVEGAVRCVAGDTRDGVQTCHNKIAALLEGLRHSADAVLGPGQGFDSRDLGKGGGVTGGLALQAITHLDHFPRSGIHFLPRRLFFR